MDIRLGLTFDDVLLQPQYSDIRSRQDVDLRTRISKNVPLNIPIVSSNMNTVTEDKMAIAMARNGGIGIIHRYCSIEDQVQMVKRVKRAESYIINEPYTASKNNTIGDIKDLISKTSVHSFLIVDQDNKLEGILTSRDMKFMKDDKLVKECMTPIDKMTFYKSNDTISMDEAKRIMYDNRIQKLPIIDQDYKVKSLVCLKDIERIQQRPLANLDDQGRLRCGAAIGVKENDIDRAKQLIDVGVDVLVIDVAHGHSLQCIETLHMLKNTFPNMDVIAGNIATAEGAEALIKAGADGIKANIGAGSICSTRLISGHGIPQLTALLDASPICKEYDVPLISDGGNRNYGNMCKALAVGANCIMVGRMIAGSDESPSKIIIKDGKRMKFFAGMASFTANLSNSMRQGLKEPDSLTSHVEGVESVIPYTGPVADTLIQVCNGLRSGFSYSGAHNINELWQKAKFIRMTQNGFSESGIHDVIQI